MNTRDRNRDAFPQLAGLVDQFRKVFGDDVKLIAGIENGKEIGKVDDELRASAREAGL